MWVPSLGQEDSLEKEMATCSSILAWEIPWTEESGRLQSMGSHRVRHDWSNLAWRQYIKKQRHYFANKGPYSQSYGFSSSHIWMGELDHKEGWVLKNCVLDYKIKPVHHKGNQPWIFIGRTDAEAEIPIVWPPDTKSQLIRNDPDVGKDWRQEEKGTTEDEMVGWHHQLNGHELIYFWT